MPILNCDPNNNFIKFELIGLENVWLDKLIGKRLEMEDTLIIAYEIEKSEVNHDMYMTFFISESAKYTDRDGIIELCKSYIKRFFYRLFFVAPKALSHWGQRICCGQIEGQLLPFQVTIPNFPSMTPITPPEDRIIGFEIYNFPNSEHNRKNLLMMIISMPEPSSRFCALYQMLCDYFGGTQDHLRTQLERYEDEFEIKLDYSNRGGSQRDEFSYVRNLIAHNEESYLSENIRQVKELLPSTMNKLIRLLFSLT